MNAPDTASDGLPARSIYHHITVPAPRRRTPFKRMTMAMRDHAGMGAFMAMLIVCATLVVLSR